MDTITINNKTLPYPNDFQLKRVPNKVNTVITVSGRTIADINGWKYDDSTLQWDTLIGSDMTNLLDAISSDSFNIVFNDVDGSHTVVAVLESRVNTKTCYKSGGNIVWKDVSVTLSFPECHTS